jgi:hypothetical protein
LTIDGNWIVLRPFSCSKNELKTFSDSVAEIPQLRYDFQSATLIYYHLHNFHRFSVDETGVLDTADLVYKVFTQWAGLGYTSWVFFRSKTHWANQIFIRYRPYKTSVDNILLSLGPRQSPSASASLRSWEEFGNESQDLNSFFQEIRLTIIDLIILAMSKIPSKQQEVASMKVKVDKAL